MPETQNQLIEIADMQQWDAVQKENSSFLAAVFYTDSSERSKEAVSILNEIKKQKADVPLVAVNASKIPAIHPHFGITSVPSVITLKNGRLIKRIEGLQERKIYEMLLGSAPRKRADGSEAPPLRITIYSSPTCPPCAVVKAHLRKKQIPFRVVDVTLDQHAAQEIVSRTGSMAVPQTDINGTVVIGADMARIDELLGIH